MEIEVICRSKVRKDFIKGFASYFAKQLKLENSRYKLLICSDPTLRKNHQVNGLCSKLSDDMIAVMLYSRLDTTQLMTTLAHEMVHVKQFAKGQYRTGLNRKGDTTYYWMGKKVNKPYLDRPWEIEAYSRESLLVQVACHQIFSKIEKSVDKK
jgi:hypothetical protein